MNGEEKVIPAELMKILCTGSDNQLCATLHPRLKEIAGTSGSEAMKKLREIIRDIVYYDLASVFVLRVLQTVYVGVGGSKEDITPVVCTRPVA